MPTPAPPCAQVFNILIQQLPALVSAMHAHLAPWVPQLMQLVMMHWHSSLLLQVLALLEQMTQLLRHALTQYAPTLVPMLVAVIERDTTALRMPSLQALQALEGFGPQLTEYACLLLPAIIHLLDEAEPGSRAQQDGLRVLQRLSLWLPLSRVAPALVPTLLRALRAVTVAQPEQVAPIVATLTTTMCQMGPTWRVLHPLAARTFRDVGLAAPSTIVAEYERLLPLALGGDMPALLAHLHAQSAAARKPPPKEAARGPKKLHVAQGRLRKLCEFRQRVTKDDWVEWMRRLSVELLRESPSPALRACAPVAQMHGPLARRLFQVGFMACWEELSTSSRESLVQSLEAAFSAPSTPTEILQALLALAEYMERHDRQLPMNTRTLGDIATRCQAFSKALHYREIEFHTHTSAQGSPRLVEALVSLHNSLQQPEAALGVLEEARTRHGLQVKLSWLEKLGRWQDALHVYERSSFDHDDRRRPSGGLGAHAPPHAEGSRGGEFAMGRMRCLSALSEWQQLARVSEHVWPQLSARQQLEVAPVLAAVRWHCQHYSAMATLTALLDPKTYEGGFYRAVLAVHAGRFDEAQAAIDAARGALHPQLAAHGVESYARVHGSLVRAQHLAEMEELIEYRRCQLLIASATAPAGGGGASLAAAEHSADDLQLARERCDCTRERWRQRLKSCGSDLRDWQTTVEVRAMALQPHEQMEAWLKFAALCRKAGRLELCRLSLSKLLPASTHATGATLPVHQLAASSFDGLMHCTPELLYAYAKYLWVCGAQPAAIELLQRLLQQYVGEPRRVGNGNGRVGIDTISFRSDTVSRRGGAIASTISFTSSEVPSPRGRDDRGEIAFPSPKGEDSEVAFPSPALEGSSSSAAASPHSEPEQAGQGGQAGQGEQGEQAGARPTPRTSPLTPRCFSAPSITTTTTIIADSSPPTTSGVAAEAAASTNGAAAAAAAAYAEAAASPCYASSSTTHPAVEPPPSVETDHRVHLHRGSILYAASGGAAGGGAVGGGATSLLGAALSSGAAAATMIRVEAHRDAAAGSAAAAAATAEAAAAAAGTGTGTGTGTAASADSALFGGSAGASSSEDGAASGSGDGRSGGVGRMDNRLVMRAFVQLGDWQLQNQQSLAHGLDEATIGRVLRSYARATQFDHRAYKAWHAWALMNFTALSHLPKVRRPGSRSEASSPSALRTGSAALSRSNSSSPTQPPTAQAASAAAAAATGEHGAGGGSGGGGGEEGEEDEEGLPEKLHERRLGHVVSALAGFFRSISLGRGREPCLQDLLRLLTLWFRYGSEPRVEASLLEGFECVDIDMWLLVIPQACV